MSTLKMDLELEKKCKMIGGGLRVDADEVQAGD
jgi:hypothetical protein